MAEIIWIPAFAGMTGANRERRRKDNSIEFNHGRKDLLTALMLGFGWDAVGDSGFRKFLFCEKTAPFRQIAPFGVWQSRRNGVRM